MKPTKAAMPTTDVRLDLHLDVNSGSDDIPAETAMCQWVGAALTGRRDEAELSVYVVDDEEGADFNRRYRGKEGPTNVLSFPADLDLPEPLPLLGDLVICAPVVTREAREQGKSGAAHWCHMLVHGTLHLLGYNHINDDEADRMERLESDILVGLGFPPPYEEQETPSGDH